MRSAFSPLSTMGAIKNDTGEARKVVTDISCPPQALYAFRKSFRVSPLIAPLNNPVRECDG